MSRAAALWAASADLAQASRDTPFVRGLADGTLRREQFAGYVAQDAHFLRSFTRAYALALAGAPDDAVLPLAELIAGVREELRLHASYAARWGARADPPAAATLAYTDFLLATAATGGLGRTLAAMTPCLRLYAWLGQSLEAAGPYEEWVRTYADPGFEQLTRTLEALLDRYAGEQDETAYRRAMELERAFFAAAAD